MVGRVMHCGMVALAIGCGRTPVFVQGESEDESGAGVDESPRDCEVDLDSHAQDCDDDGVPDGDDPFPSDPARPGRARSDVIYANSATRLYVVDPVGDEPPRAVGDFELLDGNGGQVTDIAIDHYGVFYAVTFSELYACDPELVRCWALGELPTNSLAFLPVGVLDDDDDTLVTLAGSTWTRVDLRGPELSTTVLGSVASAYSSSGDVVYDGDDYTWFTSQSLYGDILVSILPGNGASDLTVVAEFSDYGVFGLAAFDGRIWAFDEIGSVFHYEQWSNVLEHRSPGPEGFWGAAAHVDAR